MGRALILPQYRGISSPKQIGKAPPYEAHRALWLHWLNKKSAFGMLPPVQAALPKALFETLKGFFKGFSYFTGFSHRHIFGNAALKLFRALQRLAGRILL